MLGPGCYSICHNPSRRYSDFVEAQPKESSWATSPATRRVMQANRGRDTGPEMRIRRELHALGLRFRVGVRVEPNLRRTADVALKGLRLAIFVDGCFWHGCPEHSHMPKANVDFWRAKIARNVERDAETNDTLRARGWTVLRIWEHEDVELAARRVQSLVVELKRVTPRMRDESIQS